LETSIDAIPGTNQKNVPFGLGFIISTILRRKSQYMLAQILYLIVGVLFKILSIRLCYQVMFCRNLSILLQLGVMLSGYVIAETYVIPSDVA
jgi:hypothetical protein